MDMAKVLLIDDDEEYVAALSCMLTHHGFTVTTAHDGQVGIALAQAEIPDLILLDNMMSTDLEGIETARMMHRDPLLKDIPVIMITATRQMMDLPFALQPADDWLPVKAVLEKPVKADELIAIIKKYLN